MSSIKITKLNKKNLNAPDHLAATNKNLTIETDSEDSTNLSARNVISVYF